LNVWLHSFNRSIFDSVPSSSVHEFCFVGRPTTFKLLTHYLCDGQFFIQYNILLCYTLDSQTWTDIFQIFPGTSEHVNLLQYYTLNIIDYNMEFILYIITINEKSIFVIDESMCTWNTNSFELLIYFYFHWEVTRVLHYVIIIHKIQLVEVLLITSYLLQRNYFRLKYGPHLMPRGIHFLFS